MSPFEKSSLSDWYEKFRYFKDYPIVGKVSTPPSNLVLTEEELKKVRGLSEVPPGRVDAPIYVAVKGDIFDVSYGGKEMYGEKSTYFIFTGIDASRALAKMSFSPEELNNRNIYDLSEGELKILNDWHDKFALKRLYPIVGKLLPVSTVQ